MDKITKVQEVSSFIVNFDNKYWNEVIIRLTIIGIRYVTNNYKNIFTWKLEDLNIILDNLTKNCNIYEKNPEIIKKENNNCHYNYSNTSLLKREKEKNYKKKVESKKLNINNSMLLLSEKNFLSNNKYLRNYKKLKKNNNASKNSFNKNNKSYRNKILSLNDQHKSDNNVNIVVSNFPFYNYNHLSNMNNCIYNIEKTKNNKTDFFYNYNQEQKNYSFNINNKIDMNKYNINNENNKLYNEIPLNLKNIKDINNSNLLNSKKDPKIDFISALRKISNSKEHYQKNKIITNPSSLYHSQPKLHISSYSSSLKEEKEKNLIRNNNYRYTDLSYNSKKKSDLDINIKNNNSIKEKNLSKTFNRKYNFKSTNDNLEIYFQYGTNDKEMNNNNKKISLNKYLKDPNYSTKKIKKYKEMNFEYISNDDKILDNYKSPNTDRYSCHYLYENKENKENIDKNALSDKNDENNKKEN